MKVIYKIFVSLIAFFMLSNTYAAKNLKLVIDNVQIVTSAYGNGGKPDKSCVGGCSGLFKATKEPDIRWRIEDGSGGAINDVNDGCQGSVCEDCSAGTRNVGAGYQLYSKSYDCATDWPSGNARFKIFAEEWDCAGACTATSIDLKAEIGFNIPIPGHATNGTNLNSGSQSVTKTDDVDCGNMTVKMTVTYHWEVSGSFSIHSDNDNMCNATNLGTINPGGSTGYITQNNTCMTTQSGEPRTGNMSNTMWYKFKTPATGLASVNITAEEAGAGANKTAVAIYKKSSGACSGTSGLTEVGFDRWCAASGGTVTVECLEGNTDYYVQLGTGYNFSACTNLLNGERSTGNYRLRITASTDVMAPDNICSAIRVGSGDIGKNQTVTTGTYTNLCSTVNTGGHNDPPSAQPKNGTDWFYFTTPAVVPAYYTFKFNNIDFGLNAGLEGQIYKKTGGTCPPTLQSIGSWDPTACGVEEESGEFCLEPNSTYYIMVDPEQDGICGGRGKYQVVVKGANVNKVADNFCDATDISSVFSGNVLSKGESKTYKTFSNLCATSETGEPNAGRTVWLKFKTAGTVGDLMTIDANGLGALGACVSGLFALSRVDVYTSNAESCAIDSLVQNNVKAVVDQSKYEIECPRPDTWYYLQLQDRSGGCNYLTMEVEISMSNTVSPDVPVNDDVCDATNLGNSSGFVLPEATTTLLNQNNQCASMQVNETNLGGATVGDRTIWYKFKTNDTPPIEATINATYNNSLTNNRGNCSAFLIPETFFPRVRAYKSSQNISNGCSQISHLSAVPDIGTTLGIDWSQGEFKIECLEPNTWYYVQVYTGAGSVCDDGEFDIKLIGGPATIPGPDYICIPATETVAGQNGYLGTVNSASNTNLRFDNHTTRCATVSSGDPDNTTALSSLNNTTWYRFSTPNADYSDGTLMHLYEIEVERLSTSSALTYPALYFYKSTNASANRACPDNSPDYNHLQYIDRDEVDLDGITNGGNARIRDLCLEPNTDYYIQIDPVGLGRYVDYNVVVKKSAFRPGNDICEATDMPAAVFQGLNTSTPPNSSRMAGAPFFNLPHSNKCASSDAGEPNVKPGAPGGAGNNYTASVWYQFTTDANPAEWIEWDHSSKAFRGHRGGGCMLGEHFGSNIFIYKSKNNSCSYPSLQIQSEYDFAWEIPGASAKPGVFRLRCPEPNTTYYVQVQDSDFFSAGLSTCYEGIYDLEITTAGSTISPPVNDEPCGAIHLGTVPVGGAVDSEVPGGNRLFDNFCATPSYGFNPDPDHELARDVWFTFVAPPSGSVMITAQSAPNKATYGNYPDADKNIDLQVAIWEPIMGDHNKTPFCDDPRFLWTPLMSRNHGLFDYQDANLTGAFDVYYNIVDTRNNILSTKGNSLIASCLDPGKLYYIQVDGADYTLCDLTNGGDCTMGYFALQVTDAGLYDMASTQLAPQGNDEPCYATSLNVQPYTRAYNSLQWQRGSNLCATGFNDPLPSTWNSTDATVWYKFVAPTSGKVKIRAENVGRLNRRDKLNPNSPNSTLATSNADYHNEINLQLALYTLSNCMNKSSLVEITSSYDKIGVENNPLEEDDYIGVLTDGTDEYMVARCLVPGQTYYIMLDGENDPSLFVGVLQEFLPNSIKYVTGDYRISVQEDAPPAYTENDNVCDAFEIPGVNTLAVNGTRTTGKFSNDCATIEPHIEGAGKVAEKIEGRLWSTIPAGTSKAKHTLWFKFRAPSSGKVEIKGIDDSDDKMDIAMALYDFPGENCNMASSGYMIEGDYDPGIITGNATMEVECLVPGRYYYLQVDGESNSVYCTLGGSNCERGIFHLEIKHLPDTERSDINHTTNSGNHAAHDNLCDAINFGQLNPGNTRTVLQDNNRCSTEEINEPGSSGWNLNPFDDQLRSVWYRFNTGMSLGPLSPGTITIEVERNSLFTCLDLDLDLFEYTGNFNTTTCKNQANQNKQFDRLLRVGKGTTPILSPTKDVIELECPRPNKTYFIRVTGSSNCPLFGDTQGKFDLKVSMDGISITSPPNDDICDSRTGSANMGTIASGASKTRNGHNFCATQELGEPNTSQNAVQSEPEYDETVWYRFRTSNEPGEITIEVEPQLALSLAALPDVNVYKGATANYNPCDNFDGLIHVGHDVGTWTLAGGITKQNAKIKLPCPSPNWNYFIQIDGVDMALLGVTPPGWLFSDEFSFDVTVTDDGTGSQRPVNDNIADALPVDDVAPLNGQLVSGGTLTAYGNNMCATIEIDEPNVDYVYTDHRSRSDDETVWYYFITPSDPGVTTVRVRNDPAHGSFNPNFHVYYNDGTAPSYARITEAPTSKLIEEGNSGITTSQNVSKAFTCLLPNTKYYIQIDGNDAPTQTDQGYFIVTVTDDGSGNPAPTNDLICQATDLGSSLVKNGTKTFNESNKCSWEEIGEPNTSQGLVVTNSSYEHTVWYKFQAPWDGEYTINVDNGKRYTLYSSRSGSYNCANPAWTNLTRISKENVGTLTDSKSFSCLVQGQWYYLQVQKGNVGNFDLTIQHSNHDVPDHDMICKAWDFGTVNNTTVNATNQSNKCASQEISEPNVNGDDNNINALSYDKTLWYKFRTPADIGDWRIEVKNASGLPIGQRISAAIVLYESSSASYNCNTPAWGNLSEKASNSYLSSFYDASIDIECYKLKPNTNYYIQVQGFDAGNEVGTNFTVSVKHTPKAVGSNDNICQATTLTVGAAPHADNNYCATTQEGEVDISPSPQDPFEDGRNYDETMWYKFRAPAEGYVDIRATSSNMHIELDLYEIPSGSSICSGSNPNWNQLLKLGSAQATLTNRDVSLKNECLIPNRWYYVRIDGRDGITFTDRGDYTIQVINEYEEQPVVCEPVPNDDPCNLPPAFDISTYVLEDPCPSGDMNYINKYTVSTSTSPRIDCATRTAVGSPCGEMINCSDYWFKFKVPIDSEGGVRIQGDDEYGASNATNSKQVVAAYRGDPCSPNGLQFLGCDFGGSGKDVEFDIGAVPGETIYLQVFNDNAPSNPNYSSFGLCVSTRCIPKTECGATELTYETPQCWNLDTKTTSGNNGMYGHCIPDKVKSENYFTFNTSCDGDLSEKDTVTIVFSVTDVASNTALAIYEDATPCDGVEDATIINCVPFGNCIGCSPISTFSQTYQLDKCKTYVIQIVGEKDGNDGSSGQIYVFKSDKEPPVLPVELVSFTGYNDGEQNVLHWNTASELNTEHFVVEKSTDGRIFESIGLVSAMGNTSEPQNYTFVDAEPWAGNNYYRLKIVDHDSQFGYSHVINIELEQSLAEGNSTEILLVYPNPTDNQAQVEMYVQESMADFEIQVVNILGQAMHSEFRTFLQGKASFEVDASKYAQGEYVITVTNKASKKQMTAKLIKQ